MGGHTLILRLSNLIAVSAARLLRGASVPECGPRQVDLSPTRPVSWQVQCSDIPDRGGWQTVMLADAAKRDYVSEDEFGEVEGMLAFFTVNSRLLRKEIWTSLLAEASNVWNVSTSLSDITAWRDSLPKSNQVETTEATPMNHLSGIR